MRLDALSSLSCAELRLSCADKHENGLIELVELFELCEVTELYVQPDLWSPCDSYEDLLARTAKSVRTAQTHRVIIVFQRSARVTRIMRERTLSGLHKADARGTRIACATRASHATRFSRAGLGKAREPLGLNNNSVSFATYTNWDALRDVSLTCSTCMRYGHYTNCVKITQVSRPPRVHGPSRYNQTDEMHEMCEIWVTRCTMHELPTARTV